MEVILLTHWLKQDGDFVCQFIKLPFILLGQIQINKATDLKYSLWYLMDVLKSHFGQFVELTRD